MVALVGGGLGVVGEGGVGVEGAVEGRGLYRRLLLLLRLFGFFVGGGMVGGWGGEEGEDGEDF